MVSSVVQSTAVVLILKLLQLVIQSILVFMQQQVLCLHIRSCVRRRLFFSTADVSKQLHAVYETFETFSKTAVAGCVYAAINLFYLSIC